jgi:outer membrane protein OmpA-like peptidoglycan-associated protein
VRDRDGDGVHDGRDSCPDVAAGDHPDPARAGCPLNDSDRDGVFDPQDQCPTTPAGPTPDPDHDRWGCPDGDTDADHVVNHQDQCPNEPPGLLPDPARPGCPLADRDHDNVPDTTDACPDQAGAPSPNPRRNGCPGLVSVDNRAIHINRPVFFATNSDRILPRSRPVLQAVADALRAMPEIHHISIEGHTDDVGDDTRNMQLSQRRAASVMQWLSQNGIEAARLEAHGFGETRPLAQGTTAADRAQNRRVEFNILDVSMNSSAPPASPAPASAAPASPAAPAVRAPASVTSRPEVHAAPARGRRHGR